MKVILTGANIVILASSFNPSIVSKEWLIRKGIAKDTPKNFTHTPVFSFFESDNFSITLVPDRFQLEVRKINDANLKQLVPMAEKFASSLPETPYTAIGVNYLWQAEFETKEVINKILKGIFTFNWDKTKNIFKEQDVSLGSIVWLNYAGFLMKLSILPSLETKKCYILCDFNYHANITGEVELKEMLSKSSDTFKHSNEIVNELLVEKKNG